MAEMEKNTSKKVTLSQKSNVSKTNSILSGKGSYLSENDLSPRIFTQNENGEAFQFEDDVFDRPLSRTLSRLSARMSKRDARRNSKRYSVTVYFFCVLVR